VTGTGMCSIAEIVALMVDIPTNMGFLDFKSSVRVAWKRTRGAMALTSKHSRMTSALRSAAGTYSPVMPLCTVSVVQAARLDELIRVRNDYIDLVDVFQSFYGQLGAALVI